MKILQRILLVGAASDMGIALAKVLAAEAPHLQLAARQVSRLQPLKDELTAQGCTCELLEFDAEALETHVDFYKSLTPKPQCVVVLFGVMGLHVGGTTDLALLKQLLVVNYVGAVTFLEQVAADFESRPHSGGLIVGVSSVAGERGRRKNYLYGSAKAGFTAYLSGLRARLHLSGHHVLTVLPGLINTKMVRGRPLPKGLTSSPEEAAHLIVKAMNKRKSTLYIKPRWRFVMMVIKLLPEFLFKRIHL
jgi:decaprenylphospho-beta-D-erythro-pentofuranosid-2-ulose 2-reductase